MTPERIAEIQALVEESGLGSDDPGDWYVTCAGEELTRRCGEFIPELLEALREAQKALCRINAIRNDIVGRQSINWSAHIYPLVAALNEAGQVGLEYKPARDLCIFVDDLREKLEKVHQQAEDAEQRGYQRGVQAAIEKLELYTFGMRDWTLPAVLQGIRALLPVAANPPPPAEEGDSHRAQRLRFIEGCREIGKVLKGTPLHETPAEEGEDE